MIYMWIGILATSSILLHLIVKQNMIEHRKKKHTITIVSDNYSTSVENSADAVRINKNAIKKLVKKDK